MAQIPPCANHLEGTCERSDTIVSKETDTSFVIYCRTCKSVNVFPKDRDEKSGRYNAFLSRKAKAEQVIRELDRRPIYG